MMLIKHRLRPCHRNHQLIASFASSQSSSSSSSKPKTWERSAKLVKNTDTSNKYLEHIRSEVVDPSLQLKTIEDELCGAIGKALGKQGEKILHAMREMNDHKLRYQQLLSEESFQAASDSAHRYNEARQRAIKARWELLVHRQAVGFTVGNHSYVYKTFHIHEALPVKFDEVNDTTPPDSSDSVAPKKEKFGDQLDWWATVGRWR